MFVVHASKKLRDRVREEPDSAATRSTTALGAWYATVLLWKPRVALPVNEATLLPAFVPLAPAATAIDRFPEHLGAARQAHSIDPAFVTAELTATAQHSYAKTANRSVVGIMNELTHLASHARPQAARRAHRPVVLAGPDAVLAALRSAHEPRLRAASLRRGARRGGGALWKPQRQWSCWDATPNETT